MTSTISVALCTHNGARFIEVQLRSILQQTRLPDEIVLSDDASGDGTVAVAHATVAAFRRKNPSSTMILRVLQNDTALGVVKNFEQAVTACEGELIFLCDQDDRWVPERVATMSEQFTDRPDLLLLHSDARLVDDEGVSLGYSLFDSLEITSAERSGINSGDGFSVLVGRNVITGATTAFRRELLEYALPFPQYWIHDEWLAVIAASIGRIDFLAAQLIDYRQHAANEIGASKLDLRGRIRKLREPREERNQNLVNRDRVLIERLTTVGDEVPVVNFEKAQAKLAHDRFRLQLPRGRFRRLRPVLTAARAGQYAKFGRGRIDVVRDLLQPA